MSHNISLLSKKQKKNIDTRSDQRRMTRVTAWMEVDACINEISTYWVRMVNSYRYNDHVIQWAGIVVMWVLEMNEQTTWVKMESMCDIVLAISLRYPPQCEKR